ncbi:MAG: RNA 2',3'-cyclic phosphodiesterase [Balneolales bacterium]
MKKKRIFIVIPISDDLKGTLVEHFEHHDLPGKPTPRENLHITVHFLGETEEEYITGIKKQITQIATDTPVFSLEASDIILQKGRVNRMVWLKLIPSDPFTQLVKRIRSSLDPETIEAGIAPHITLSRLKKAHIPTGKFPITIEEHLIKVDRLELWESKIGGKNPLYKELQKFHLKQDN